MEIRLKDKLFCAIAIPLASAAAYVYFDRLPTTARAEALSGECATLVASEDFAMERAAAERQLAEARRERDAERAVPMPAAKVKADRDETAAARELAVLEIFRRANLTVASGRDAPPGESRAPRILQATGLRTQPLGRAYELGGRYESIQAALREMAVREMAVIPERVEMPRPDHWKLVIWL